MRAELNEYEAKKNVLSMSVFVARDYTVRKYSKIQPHSYRLHILHYLLLIIDMIVKTENYGNICEYEFECLYID